MTDPPHLVRCAECGRFHCPKCTAKYTPNTHKVDWVGHERDGQIDHMIVKARGADFQTARRSRMCEWATA